MFFIPGPVIAALTFPGVIIHEAGHLFFCRLFKLQVFDVCFFRFGNPAGYVIHQQTEDFKAQFFVSMGPFFANTLLCVLFCTAAFLPVWELKVFDPSGCTRFLPRRIFRTFGRTLRGWPKKATFWRS